MNRWLAQLDKVIRERQLFAPEQTILIAVSGGLDSMVLLQGLHELAPRYHWRLVAAHFNHQLRGPESEADEAFVRAAVAALGWPFETGRGEVRQWQTARKLSLEMAARELRHHFLAQTARRLNIPSIALAHHADDQIELFFLRLFRGSGGLGMRGLRWHSPSPADSEITLARPLLNQTKQQLREQAAHWSLAFREDSSNQNSDPLRNRIRNELLPMLLRDYEPGLGTTLPRVMEVAGADADLAFDSARQWRQQPDSLFESLPVAVQRQVILSQLQDLQVAPNFELVEFLRLFPDRPKMIATGKCVHRSRSGDLRWHVPAMPYIPRTPIQVTLQDSHGEVAYDQVQFRWKIKAYLAGEPGPSKSARSGFSLLPAGHEVFDAEQVGPQIILRHWQPGDRFQPIGMPCSVKIQDLLVNAKVPQSLRHRLVIAVSSTGEIFWLEGFRISNRYKLDIRTKKCLDWTWSRENATLVASAANP